MLMSYDFGRGSWGGRRGSGRARRLLGVILLLVAVGTSVGWGLSRREVRRIEERARALQQQLDALKADGKVDEVAAYELPEAPADQAAWQAYVLFHQAEAMWRGAYESWLASDWLGGEHRDERHSLLLATLRQELAAVATATYLNEQVNRLRDVIIGGEGEVSFPSRDELVSLGVVAGDTEPGTVGDDARGDGAEATGQRKRMVVEVKARRHVPAYEWSGRAYVQDVTWQIELIRTPLGWRIGRVTEQPGDRRSEG
jgi:hypothetical protein